MKIHQLPMGARFEYEGEEYVKTGPLLATGKGGQRLIPKYAVLKVEGGNSPPVPPATAPDRQSIIAAFDAFCETCTPLIPADRQADFADARAAFLKTLG
jgi:hypothetical protein